MQSVSRMRKHVRSFQSTAAALLSFACLSWAGGPAMAQTLRDGFHPPELCCGVHAHAGGPVAVQPDGKVMISGGFLTQNGSVTRLHVDGASDPSFSVGADVSNALLGGSVTAMEIGGNGELLIVGSGSIGGLVTYRNADGTSRFLMDWSSIDGGVDTASIQQDGKILLTGAFTSVHGVPRTSIVRLNSSGSLDTDFDPGTGADGAILAVAVQSDGRILLAGNFNVFDGHPRNGIARLNADGSVDPDFDPGIGADGSVSDMAVQVDGKILLGGSFDSVAHSARKFIARLNLDGSLDGTFGSPSGGPDGAVRSLELQPDGKALIGGAFMSVDGEARWHVARLHTDGTLDSSYSLVPGSHELRSPRPRAIGVNQPVDHLALQPDGRLIISGRFTQINGDSFPGVARLNIDGTLDTDLVFGPTNVAPHQTLRSVAVQPDGRLLLGGSFTHIHGVPRRTIARLGIEGALDLGFDPHAGPTHPVPDLQPSARVSAIQPDGKLLVTGMFDAFDGLPRPRLVRLDSDGGVDFGFVPDEGINWVVDAMLRLDGRIVATGGASVDGAGRFLFQLKEDGSLDRDFDSMSSFDGRCFDGTWLDCFVSGVVLQTDGKILVRVTVTETTSGPVWDRIDRLNPDGSLDAGFQFGGSPTGPNIRDSDASTSFLQQPDGKMLLTGPEEIAGQAIPQIARLNPDGSLDTGFAVDVTSGAIYPTSLQADGRIFVSSEIGTQVEGLAIARLARLNPDGSLDRTFGFESSSWPHGSAGSVLQSDGRVVVFGRFLPPAAGECCEDFLRLATAQAAQQKLESTSDWRRIEWLRNGAAPEFSRVIFDASIDGHVWTPVAAGAPLLSGSRIEAHASASPVAMLAYQDRGAPAPIALDTAAPRRESPASTRDSATPYGRYSAAARHAAQFEFNLSDAPAVAGMATLKAGSAGVPAGSDPVVVISQVYGGGGEWGSTWKADFIELFNAGSTARNLDGWTLQYSPSRNEQSWSVVGLAGVTLQPGQYYLVQVGGSGDEGTPLPSPDASGPGELQVNENRVALVASTNPLFGVCPLNQPDDYPGISDFVGMGRPGAITCFQGSAASAQTNSRAVLRHRGGCTQRHDNGLDFYLGAPVPRTTSSAINECTSVASTITAVSGTTQRALIGSTFAEPLAVRVTDGGGTPQAGVPVTFYPPIDETVGLSGLNVVTDQNGEASVTALATGTTSAPQYVTAVAGNAESTIRFQLTITPHYVTPAGGTPQVAVVGTAFSAPLTAKVTDENGAPIPGKSVYFGSPSSGAGVVLSSTTAVTDENGNASVTASANSALGAYQVFAFVLGTWGAGDALFDLENVEDTGSSELSIEILGGSSQSTALNRPFAAPLRVRVTNEEGAPVEEVPVHFLAPAEGAAAVLSQPIAVTDGNGEATITASANTITGSYEVSARIGNTVTPVRFELSNLGQISVIQGSGQSAPLWNAFGGVIVQVTGDGQPLPNIAVNLSAPASGASAGLPAASVLTDNEGKARIAATANGIAGSYAVTARIAGNASPADVGLTNVDPQVVGRAWLGWSVDGLNLPRNRNVWIRARGITADGSVHESAKVFYPTGGYTATPIAGANGRIEPAIPQGGNAGTVLSFTIVPDAGHGIASVTGCGGSLNGSTYLIAPLAADCKVLATFSGGVVTHTVTATAGPGGAIDPSGTQAVNEGETMSFVLLPNSGQQIAQVGGTCGGDLVDAVFTTAPVTAGCTVEAVFEPISGPDRIFANGFDAAP